MYSVKKRGLSEVVANLLIILLVLVAVGVVWVVVKNVIDKGAADIELGKFTFDISIESAYVSGADVVVSVRRAVGGGSDFTGLNFIFTSGQESFVIKKTVVIQETARKTFTFNSTEIPGIGAGDEVSVAPLYNSDSEEKIGNPTDTKKISGTPPADGGDDSSGGSGGAGSPGTGFCGDTLIQSPNSNGINEQCDGENLDGRTCLSLGLSSGTLSCYSSSSGNACQFDTTLCNGGIPASCNGVWGGGSEDAEVECDGTPLPYGCTASCLCDSGYSENFNGGCNLNPPINTGTIFSIWPAGAAKYFDSEDLPVDVSGYTSNYVNFTSASENGCFRITFAEYLELNGRSYLRTEFVASVSPGNEYKVWEAANCGQ